MFELEGKKYLLYINTLENTWSNAVAILMVDITLQESMNSLKREFFANASHELKSPLTSIIGYQQLIQQGILTTNEEIQDATLRTIKEAQRMNKLIIEMLDLSRLENNVQTLIEKIPKVSLPNIYFHLIHYLSHTHAPTPLRGEWAHNQSRTSPLSSRAE